MPNKTQSIRNEPLDDSWSVSETLTDVAGEVKNKASELGRTASNKIDENRHAAASGLETAALILDEKAETLPGGPRVTSLAHATADKLGLTADYVREHDVGQMMRDVETLVKNNPGPSLLTAAVMGFLVGRAFTSRD
jgi:hypothetical protein